METEVSIIVPVYKTEKWLNECVESILNNSFKDFELILVDDGSPDKCGEMCDGFAAKDERIRVIHQENAGVSAARNRGIEKACGKYIMFVDSDDTIDSDTIASLYESAVKENADMVLCGIRYYYEDSGENVPLPLPYAVFTFPDEVNKYYYDISKAYGFSACYAKLIKRNILDENKIRFREDFSILEDGTMLFETLGCCKKIVSLPQTPCKYRKYSEESLMKRFNRNAIYALENYVNVAKPLRESLDEKTRSIYYSQQFDLLWKFITQIYTISNLSEKEKFVCLREYLSNKVSKNVAENTRASSKSKAIQIFLVKHGCARTIHNILRLKFRK